MSVSPHHASTHIPPDPAHATGMVKKERDASSAEGDMSPAKKTKTEETPAAGVTLTTAGVPPRLSTMAAVSDRGCLDDEAVVKPGLYTKFLAVCTNNFKRSGDMHHEKGNTFAVLNFVPMGMLPTVGYTSSPYEPRADVPKKQRVYFDEKNVPINGKPVPTMTLHNGKLLCRSFKVVHCLLFVVC